MKVTPAKKFAVQAVFSVLLIGLIGWLDFLTGGEISLFPLYMIPVMLMSWDFGWRGALLSVLLAVASWIYTSIQVGQEFTSESLRFYNGLVRGVVFGQAGFFIILFKNTLNTHRMRMDAMRSLLNVCQSCGAVQGSDGQWVPMKELLKMGQKPAPRECIHCAKLARDDAPAR